MTLKAILKTTERFVLNNSPAILTAIGVAGTITTAVLAGKASYYSAFKLADTRHAREIFGEELTSREEFELVYKEFIPAAIAGAVTILAIIGANHVSTKRAAALAAAFKISEQMADEYRHKVIEKMGKKNEEMARSELVKERMERVNTSGLIIEGSQVAFWDPWAGRAFVKTKEQVQQAVNQINHQIQHNFCANVSEFYDLLDLPRTGISDEFGWNNDAPLDPYYTGTLLSDGNPAIEIRFEIQPIRNYYKYGV